MRGTPMKNRLFLLLSLFAMIGQAEAAFVYHDGELTRKEDTPYLSAADHFELGMNAFHHGDMNLAVKHLHIVSHNFSDTSYGQDAYFYLGIAYYRICEFDLANCAFNGYLSCQSNPRFFQEAVEYKFAIAEQFRRGAKRHFRGSRFFPKWASGKSLAIDIYDEIVSSMPGDEMTIKALYSKACLLWHMGEFRDSVDAFQTIIRRFPKNELAPESYVRIMKVYIDQAKREKQNPDLLTFAQMNLNRFEADFPRDSSLEVARRDYLHLKEMYAQALYDIAIFYERVNEPRAAVIYYQKAYIDFPETVVAQKSRCRLSTLCPAALIEVPENEDEDEEGSEEFPDLIDEIEFVQMDNVNKNEIVARALKLRSFV